MINEKQAIKISKFLSLVLRHRPEVAGITLDENGWTDTDLLIKKSNAAGFPLTAGLLKHIVDTNSKKRFSFNETFDKIRANQGHSVTINLGYLAQEPPEILYHGTGLNSVQSVIKYGLDKRSRHHVHLSQDIETAIQVGQRHGKPFVFQVMAGQMFRNAFTFYVSDNGIWLTDFVPAKYLQGYTKQ